MTDEEEWEEVDDMTLFIEERDCIIKELENDKHELLDKLNIQNQRLNELKKENEELKKLLKEKIK